MPDKKKKGFPSSTLHLILKVFATIEESVAQSARASANGRLGRALSQERVTERHRRWLEAGRTTVTVVLPTVVHSDICS